ncbi:MAG: Gfo/Idh/MocA family oxidoreductase [Tepidisphaeraceae bacterium]
MERVGVAIIGTGAITLANHLPGLALCPQAKVLSLCDSDQATLLNAAQHVDAVELSTDWHLNLCNPDVDALIISTPNFNHHEIALAAIAAGKHVLCEKPLALNYADALQMYRAAELANVRHMTAFTYRFVPAMRYMKHLVDFGEVGQPLHFRAQRFQDWGDHPLGWRQVKKLAGSGEMGDMLCHRIDYAHHLIGPITRLVADLRTFIPERGGQVSDVDDWVSMICQFSSDTTGVLESTKLATGRGEGHRGQDVVEINGTDGTIVYSTQKPLELQIGKRGDSNLRKLDVPAEFLVWEGSPRDPLQGDPLVTFRYDQGFEFIDAIVNQRPCRPSFREGAMTQAVMEAVQRSVDQREWVEVASVD